METSWAEANVSVFDYVMSLLYWKNRLRLWDSILVSIIAGSGKWLVLLRGTALAANVLVCKDGYEATESSVDVQLEILCSKHTIVQ